MSQSNTQVGQIVLPAASDLTGMEGRLVGIIEVYNQARLNLQNNETNQNPLFVVVDGGAEGKSTAALPLSPDRNVRVRLEGACAAGAILVCSSVAGPHIGKVRELPTSAGTYVAVGIAEEPGIDEQLVKLRPTGLRKIVVT